jgi:hypothetical protein
MDIGLLHNKRTTNIGDDIQTYALENLLPRVDRMVDRENMNTDECFDHQPTATPMAAWFMGKKWQWPPADCLRPLCGSVHAFILRYREGYRIFPEQGCESA